MREKPLALLADDDLTFRVLARTALEQAGFIVEEVEDGVAALDVFDRLPHDIVLLDVLMPRMDGFVVCSVLRDRPEGAHVPVLMITGQDDEVSIHRAYEAGATDFITKPIQWEILGHRVRYMWRARCAADQLLRSEEKNRALINAIPDLMLQVDGEGRIIDFKAPGDLVDLLPEGSVLGKRIEEAFCIRDSMTCRHHMEEALRTGERQVFEQEVNTGREKRFFESRIVASGGGGAVAIVRDITERKKAEERIVHMAYHDSLTALPNRHFFLERLGYALEQARRYGRLLAVLFFDLDRFKRINDTLGHSMGDMLLQAVAERLAICVRRSDVSARMVLNRCMSSVARLGGDEFTILLTEISFPHDVARVARRILDSISKPYTLEGRDIYITASMGLTLYPFDGDDVETLLKNADAAMYHAKDQGRNNFQFYTRSLNASAMERLSMEGDLRRALDRDELVIYYQPQIDIHTGRVVAVEALIRWRHPEVGLIGPMEFIPLAEKTGLIMHRFRISSQS